tara:strand:- start:1280 stop:2803 length:1524 start_codon:yes stop_codon:yes gene_type:complete
MNPERVNYNYCEDLPSKPLSKETRILVTGANGYVARRLIPELVHRGYFVRCLYRNNHTPSLLTHERIETAYADCLDLEELTPVFEKIEYAYYFIHSMRAEQGKFAQLDKRAARNFATAASAVGVKKIIYLGGLGNTGSGLSPHLRSRQEVGKILSQGNVPVIQLRAAIIIGAGSASYELLKSLVSHNRLVPFLSEFNSLCQPIAIRDVIKYLVGSMESTNMQPGVYPIGSEEIFSYKDLINRMARCLRRPVFFIDFSWVPLPVNILCRIYSYWLHLFTSVPVNIISLLLASLKSNVVCFDIEIRKLIPFQTITFDEAVQRALDRESKSMVHSHWSDVPPDKMIDFLPMCEYETSDFIIDEHWRDIPASPEKIFELLSKMGGSHGWYGGNCLWRIRGFIDRLLGGVGLQRGRRDDLDLRVGDSLDFWRVEELLINRQLLLRAEMITPGLSWLQFELSPISEKITRLTLKAHFIPNSLWGHIYWYSLSSFHNYIFQGMLDHFYYEAVSK